VDLSGLNGKVYKLGGKYEASVILGLRGVPPSSIGLELVVTDKDKEGNLKLIHSQEFKMEKFEGGKAYFKMQIVPLNPGVFNYGFRIFPKHKDLPHRQDFNLVSWV